MRRIKVVHLQKIAGISGSEKHVLQLVASLDRAVFDPLAVVLEADAAAGQEYARRLHDARVGVATFGIRSDVDPVLFAQLVRWFRRERPDIVHTHLIHADFHGIAAARLAGVPVIVSTKHNDDRFRRRRAIVALERWLARRVNRTIAISEALRQFILVTTQQPPQSITTVRYGYDSALDEPGDARSTARNDGDRDAILAVGRLVEQKGHDVLIRAFKQVARTVENARLVIVGEGEQRQRLEALIRDLDLGDRVTLEGHSRNVRAFMQNAVVFVHPSRWEGFGLVLLEAMAAGLPIVATRVSAIPEVVEDAVTGLLVPSDDDDALAKAMIRVLEDRVLAERLGRAGRERLDREFSVTRMARAIERIYCDALAVQTGEDFRRVDATVC